MAQGTPTATLRQAELSLCAHANLRRAMRVVSQAYDAALKPAGLKATQFTLLAVLANRGPMPLTRLAELLVMDRTTLTRNLQPLEAKGWVETGRRRDERVRLIGTTETGRAVVAQATPLWAEAQVRVTQALGPDRLTVLLDGLGQLTEAVRTD